MTDVLLIDEDYIKTNSALPDNLWGEWLLPAIREAQEMGLVPIIGSALFCHLCSEVAGGDVEERMGDLIEAARPYLLYKVQSLVIPIISVKLGNLGAVVSNDEHVQNISRDERENLAYAAGYKAEFYANMLRSYLKSHRDLYPELSESGCSCNFIKPDLEGGYVTGLWLGGRRTIC